MVSLSKNQTISLAKSSSAISQIQFGLGWDPAKKKGLFGKLLGGGDSIDLDASCVLLDAHGGVVDTVWFRQLRSNDGSIVHSGDNRTGECDGDDEVIKADLSRLPASIESLVLTVNSFTGQTFNDVANAFCRVVDHQGKELAKFTLTEQGSHTAVVIASLRRSGGEWNFTAHGNASRARTIQDMIPDIQAVLY